MNAEQIAANLKRKDATRAQVHKWTLACNDRRMEIDARCAEIAPSPSRHIPHPPERQAALLGGTDAVLHLDREMERLRVERDQCDHLEAACYQRDREIEVAEIQRAFPAAVRDDRGLMEHVSETMANFEAAVAALQARWTVIGQGVALGEAYPWNDDELAQRLELRNAVWRVRSVDPPHIVRDVYADEQNVPSTPRLTIAPEENVFPRSWQLLYERRGDVVRVRRPPRQAASVD
jgi:hypothetical protein